MEHSKIALFGGTFDPPHLGHLTMAKAVVDELGVDKVVFIPCAISPHKESAPPSSETDRVNMLKLATETLRWAAVSEIELQLPKPSFTWRTLEALLPQFSDNTRMYWILGSDQWNNLEHWARPDYLRENLHFLIIPRSNESILPKEGWKMSIINVTHPASSSAIRNALRNGNQTGEWTRWLAPKVFDYCVTHQLYQR